MKQVVLTKGKVALVDDDDYGWVNDWRWHASAKGRTHKTWYAWRHSPGGKPLADRSYSMHRLIAAVHGIVSKGFEVDHINGDGLDNRKENLRAATHSQNAMNCVPHTGYSTQYKGVGWRKDKRKFRARCWSKHLGHFDTAEDAARAYDTEARRVFGEFARLNFPEAV